MNRRRAQRRGFVTPLVLAVLLFAGLLLSAMLTRQTAQSRAVFGQTDSYKSIHAERGLLTLADAAREAATNGEFARLVLLDGPARRFAGKGVLLTETDLGGGAEARIYAEEAQGTISLDVTGSGGLVQSQPLRLLLELRDIVELSEDDARAPRLAEMTRAAGSPQVSVFTAPEEVLRAVAAVTLRTAANNPAQREPAGEGAADDAGAANRDPAGDTASGEADDNTAGEVDPAMIDALVSALIRERSSASWRREILGNDAGLSAWLNERGYTGATLQYARQFLTVSPTLFRMRVEIVEDGRVVRAFSGLFDTAQRGGESVSSRSEFLTWNEIDPGAESER